MRILLVEDEKRVADFIKKGLEEEYHGVDTAKDGIAGLEMFESVPYDLVILDIMLPRMDGLTVCKKMRETNTQVPVLMLTARSSVNDRVKGLDTGADDYLIKPFAFSELSARIRALLRRKAPIQNTKSRIGDLIFDRLHHVVTVRGEPVDLTPREFALLEYMINNAGYVVTRTMIAEHVWGIHFDSMTNIVDVYINHLRKKLEQRGGKQSIQTIRGVGYSLRE